MLDLDDIAEWTTGTAVILMLITSWFVGRYAYRRIQADPWRLSSLFALAYSGICLGISFRLGIGWLVLHIPPGLRVSSIAAADPYIITACMVLITFGALGLRMVTLGQYGERAWIASVAAASLIAGAVVVLF